MGDTWMVLPPKATKKIRIVIEDGTEMKQVIHERCLLCGETDCPLIGKYGTWNVFGSFRGLCPKCLMRLYTMYMQWKRESGYKDKWDEYEEVKS